MKVQRKVVIGVLSLLSLATAVIVIGYQSASSAVAPPLITPPPSNEIPGVLTGSGIIHYDTSSLPPIANSRMVIIQGTKDAKGVCHYRTYFSAPKGDTTPQIAREVALDPATCRVQVERGTPTSVQQNPTPGDGIATSTAKTK